MKKEKTVLAAVAAVLIVAVAVALALHIRPDWISNIHENADEAADESADGTSGEAAEEEPAEEPATEKPEENRTLKIMAAGDIHLARGVEYHINRIGKGYTYPFELIVDMLKKGDVIFANLENPFTDKEKPVYGKIAFRSRPEAFEAVRFGGFNLLNIANNHIMDQYEQGLFDTIALLEKEKIAFAGAGRNLDEARKPAIIEKNGLKIGMLSYTDMAYDVFAGNPPMSFAATAEKAGVAPREFEYIKEDIEKLRDKVDLLIVSLHWGVEYVYEVLPEQVDFAHRVIDLGADIIIGHHPHRMKGIEIYKGKPIIYSLGNLISDQNDPRNQEGFIIEMDFRGNRLESFSAIPFVIEGKSRVVPVYGDDARFLLQNQKKISEELGSKCYIENDRLVFVIEHPDDGENSNIIN